MKIDYSINPEPIMQRALENPRYTVLNARRRSPADGSMSNEAILRLTTLRFSEIKDWDQRSIWIELIYNISQDRFYARSALMGKHHCGHVHSALKHGAVTRNGGEYTCRTCGQLIKDFNEETEKVQLLGFNDEKNRKSVLEAMRLYLAQNNVKVEASQIIDRNQNKKLTHSFNSDQLNYIADQVNSFLSRARGSESEGEQSQPGEETNPGNQQQEEVV